MIDQPMYQVEVRRVSEGKPCLVADARRYEMDVQGELLALAFEFGGPEYKTRVLPVLWAVTRRYRAFDGKETEEVSDIFQLESDALREARRVMAGGEDEAVVRPLVLR